MGRGSPALCSEGLRRAARLLGVGLLVAMTAGGCIVPAPIFDENEGNQAVWVDESQLIPSLSTGDYDKLVTRNTSPTVDFRIPHIEDADLDDTLIIRWFANYPQAKAPRGFDVLESDGQLVRSAPLFQLEVCEFPDLAGVDTVLVEAVISDRGFLSLEEEDPNLPNRSLPAEAKAQTVRWRVRLEGTCP